MDLSIIEEDEVTRLVEVRVPAEAVDAEVDRVLRGLSGRVRIKGFRPGKVPMREVRRRYGASARADGVRALVERSLVQALKDERVGGTVHVRQPEVREGLQSGPVVFRFVAERYPEVTPTGYLQLELKVPRTEVTTEDVDAAVEALRAEQERLVPVEDREVVEAGDVVVASYRAEGEGDVEQIFSDDQEIRLDDENLPEGLAAGVVGATRGEAKQVVIRLPDTFAIESLKGEEVTLQLTVSEIKRRELPELDDAFAREVGKGETLLELRTKLREELEEQRSGSQEAEKRKALSRKLRERNPVPLPDGYVRAQAMEEARRSLGGQLKPEDLRRPELMQFIQAFAQQIESDVRGSIHEALIMREIGKAEKLDVDQLDLDAWFDRVASERGVPVPRLRAQFSSEDAREGLRARLLFEKVQTLLLESATVIEVDPAELEEELAAEDGAPSTDDGSAED